MAVLVKKSDARGCPFMAATGDGLPVVGSNKLNSDNRQIHVQRTGHLNCWAKPVAAEQD